MLGRPFASALYAPTSAERLARALALYSCLFILNFIFAAGSTPGRPAACCVHTCMEAGDCVPHAFESMSIWTLSSSGAPRSPCPRHRRPSSPFFFICCYETEFLLVRPSTSFRADFGADHNPARRHVVGECVHCFHQVQMGMKRERLRGGGFFRLPKIRALLLLSHH